MAALVWDQIGDRVYESGLDKGVLYLPDGSGVPWNGLISVVEKFDYESSSVYFDGEKISSSISSGEFSATMKAITYPIEFDTFEGNINLVDGVIIDEQIIRPFNLSYRTRIGNDANDTAKGYKIHILYNVIASLNDKTYETLSDDPSVVEFEWNITTIPEEVDGFRPTSHFIFNTNEMNSSLLDAIEEKLYGTNSVNASFPSLSELYTLVNTWLRIEIINNEDGTWSATADAQYLSYLDNPDNSIFQLINANVIFVDKDKYQISNS